MQGRFLGEESVLQFPLGTRLLKSLFAPLAVALLWLVFSNSSLAGLLGPSLPKGKEVEDPYLVQLFEPEFPYESIKVIETEEGKRYVVIRAKRKITDEEQTAYERKTLQGRGVFIHREWSPRSGNLMLAEMRFYRKVSDVPLVVEYSEVVAEKLTGQLASPSDDVVRSDGRHLVVYVSRDFGKPGIKLMVYPEKDAPCPDPPFVGRYPNSRKLSCREKDGKVLFLMVTKDRAEDVYEWYKGRLLEHYDQVGVDYPERSWKYGISGYGIKMRSLALGLLKDELRIPQPEAGVPVAITQDGFVSHIHVHALTPQELLNRCVAIAVWYTSDPGAAEREKAQFPKPRN
jgi:hypothetical protein